MQSQVVSLQREFVYITTHVNIPTELTPLCVFLLLLSLLFLLLLLLLLLLILLLLSFLQLLLSLELFQLSCFLSY